MPLIYEQSCL